MTATDLSRPGMPAPRARKKRNGRPTYVVYILILLLTVFFVGPFIWLVLAALKTPAEWASLPIQILP